MQTEAVAILSLVPSSGAPVRVGALSLLAHVVRHFGNPVMFFASLHGRYGVSIDGRLLRQRVHFDARPEVIAAVLAATGSEGPFVKSRMQGRGLRFLLGADNVFLGPRGRCQHVRKAIHEHFTPRSVDDMTGAILDAVDRTVETLERRIAAGLGTTTVDLQTEMTTMTLRVVLASVVGVRVEDGELASLSAAFQDALVWLGPETVNPTAVSVGRLGLLHPRARALRRANRTLLAFAARIVADRRRSDVRASDLLGALLATGLDDAAICDEILTILLAGHETTAALLTWCVSSLSRAPAARARLLAEIGSLEGSRPTATGLDRTSMPFLDQVVAETLRLYSPVYFMMRRATQDVDIATSDGPLHVAAGTEIALSPFVANRCEETWGEARTGYAADAFAPERFDPENWAKRGLGPGRPRTFAFGAGPRVCLGKHFALLETKLALARMFRTLDIRCVDDSAPALASNISVRPRGGLPVLVRIRGKHGS